MKLLRETIRRIILELGQPELDAASRIAHLSKELRGHLSEIDKMTKAADRKGLVMAGADRVLREFKAIFKGNEDVTNALDLASESVWAVLADEA